MPRRGGRSALLKIAGDFSGEYPVYTLHRLRQDKAMDLMTFGAKTTSDGGAKRIEEWMLLFWSRHDHD